MNIKKLLGIFKKIIARFFGWEKKYVSKVRGSDRWVFISYIPEVFYNLWNTNYMYGHQSRREMVEIVSVFNELGYNVYVGNFSVYHKSKHKYDIVFGIEPAFVQVSKDNPSALKIYYATGAYSGHQNSMIKQRTNDFNKLHNADMPCSRLVEENDDRLNVANQIFQIGTIFTLQTYPPKMRDKIKIVNQSSIIDDRLFLHKDYTNKTSYVWIGGGGSILKGLDLVLDYFVNHQELELYVVGTIDCNFLEVYKKNDLLNIHFMGFLNLKGQQFKDIAEKCNFLIYPSCTEGGCPGAVINAMRFGIIPIVSKWASPDCIDEVGYQLADLSVEAIHSCIQKVQELKVEEIELLSNRCIDTSYSLYNLERFRREFENEIRKMLSCYKAK